MEGEVKKQIIQPIVKMAKTLRSNATMTSLGQSPGRSRTLSTRTRRVSGTFGSIALTKRITRAYNLVIKLNTYVCVVVWVVGSHFVL